MKKIIKAISLVCLAFLLVCPVFLTGCAKNLTLNFQVEGKGGSFYKFSNSTEEMTGEPISGDVLIKEGSNFEYRVKPDSGYKIKELIIDGEVVSLSDDKKVEGVIRAFENINQNHTIKVSFEAREWNVTFVCAKEGSEPEFFKLKSVLNNTAINVGTNEFGGQDNNYWYVFVGAKKTYLVNGQEELERPLATDWVENQIIINSDRTIFCTLSKAELQQKIDELNNV